MRKLLLTCILAGAFFAGYSQVTPKTQPVIAPIDNNASKATLVSHKTKINQLFATYKDQMQKANATVAALRKELEAATKSLESQDRMGNFEIQRLMSTFNQAETLSSNVMKKLDSSRSAVINKIGSMTMPVFR